MFKIYFCHRENSSKIEISRVVAEKKNMEKRLCTKEGTTWSLKTSRESGDGANICIQDSNSYNINNLSCKRFSDEPFTERSGGLSTDRTVSGHDTPGMPSVITELFKSLYNNEWNNCYTELTKRYTDDHTIEILRRWLKVCYKKKLEYM